MDYCRNCFRSLLLFETIFPLIKVCSMQCFGGFRRLRVDFVVGEMSAARIKNFRFDRPSPVTWTKLCLLVILALRTQRPKLPDLIAICFST